jgi:hypothetical protein
MDTVEITFEDGGFGGDESIMPHRGSTLSGEPQFEDRADKLAEEAAIGTTRQFYKGSKSLHAIQRSRYLGNPQCHLNRVR